MAVIPENWGDETDIVDGMKQISIVICKESLDNRYFISKVTACSACNLVCSALHES